MANKSSTLLNAPYDLRICRIFSAVTGPIPGTCCNSVEFAVLMLMGCGGGFLFANAEGPHNRRNAANTRKAGSRPNMRAIITHK